MVRNPSPRAISLTPTGLPAWQRFALAAALPLVLFATQVRRDLWGDEVYTLSRFAALDVREIVAGPWEPNNHLAYTLLLKLLGPAANESVALRLLGVLLGALTLALVYAAAVRAADRTVAEVAVLIVGLNVAFQAHALQARGYGLSMCGAAALCCLAVGAGEGRRWRAVAIVLVGAALVYTLPTNVLLLPGVGAVATWRAGWRARVVSNARSKHKDAAVPHLANIAAGRELACWAAGGILGLALYAPVWDDVRQAALAAGGPTTAEGERASQGVTSERIPLLLSLSRQVASALVHDSWALAPWLLPGLWWAARRRFVPFSAEHPVDTVEHIDQADRVRGAITVVLALAATASMLLATALLGMRPFARNFTPLLPILGLAEAWLFVQGWRRFATWFSPSARDVGKARRESWIAPAAALVLTPFVLLYPSRLREAIARDDRVQNGYYNYYLGDFRPSAAAEFLARTKPGREPYLVMCDQADFHVLEFYLRRVGLLTGRLPAAGEPQRARLYYLAPPRPRYEFAVATYGARTVDLEATQPLESFGYFSLRRSQALENIRVSQPVGAPMP